MVSFLDGSAATMSSFRCQKPSLCSILRITAADRSVTLAPPGIAFAAAQGSKDSKYEEPGLKKSPYKSSDKYDKNDDKKDYDKYSKDSKYEK
jgi:hypothetical protein